MNPPSEHSAPSARTPLRFSPFGVLAWVAAVGFAITTAALWSERDGLSKEMIALRGEALALRTRDALAKVKISTLAAQNEDYAKCVAVVVWDGENQRGIVTLANSPRLEAGQGYQLWLIDPKRPEPVFAGGVPVGDDGLARVAFTPEHTVRVVEKFAVSIGRTGGAPAPHGPFVLLGN